MRCEMTCRTPRSVGRGALLNLDAHRVDLPYAVPYLPVPHSLDCLVPSSSIGSRGQGLELFGRQVPNNVADFDFSSRSRSIFWIFVAMQALDPISKLPGIGTGSSH